MYDWNISVLVIAGEPVCHASGSYNTLFEYMMDNYGPFKRESWRFRDTLEDVVDSKELAADSEWHSGIVQWGFALYDKDGNPFDYFIVDLASPWYIREIENDDVERAVRDYCLANDIEVSNEVQEVFDSLG